MELREQSTSVADNAFQVEEMAPEVKSNVAMILGSQNDELPIDKVLNTNGKATIKTTVSDTKRKSIATLNNERTAILAKIEAKKAKMEIESKKAQDSLDGVSAFRDKWRNKFNAQKLGLFQDYPNLKDGKIVLINHYKEQIAQLEKDIVEGNFETEYPVDVIEKYNSIKLSYDKKMEIAQVQWVDWAYNKFDDVKAMEKEVVELNEQVNSINEEIAKLQISASQKDSGTVSELIDQALGIESTKAIQANLDNIMKDEHTLDVYVPADSLKRDKAELDALMGNSIIDEDLVSVDAEVDELDEL